MIELENLLASEKMVRVLKRRKMISTLVVIWSVESLERNRMMLITSKLPRAVPAASQWNTTKRTPSGNKPLASNRGASLHT